MPVPIVNPKANPMVFNAQQGVATELQSKVPLLVAAEAQRIGGIAVGNQLFRTPAEYQAYVADLTTKAQSGNADAAQQLAQMPLMTADFSALGTQEQRIAENARLQGLGLTEGQALEKQADTTRLTDLGGNASQGLAKGYNDLNLLLQADSLRAGAKIADELNPEQAAIRKSMGQSIMGDLSLGNSLNAGESRNLSQNVRAGQAARGNLLGNASLLQEADALATEGNRMRDQRLNRGFAFLQGGTQPTAGFGTTAAEGSNMNESIIGGVSGADGQTVNGGAGWLGVQATPIKEKKKGGFGSLLGTVAGGLLGSMTGSLGSSAGSALGKSLFGETATT